MLRPSSSSSSAKASAEDTKAVVVTPSTSSSSSSSSSSSTAPNKRKLEVKEEVRPCRYRPHASYEIVKRIQRAKTQRLFLINFDGDNLQFEVLGSTGNLYKVDFGGKFLSCDCPDAAKGNHCKHQLFVFLKVLKRNETDPIIWQKGLLPSERNHLREYAASLQAPASVLANESVQKAVKRLKGEDSEEQDEEVGQEDESKRKPLEECLICYDEFTSSDKTTWCKTTCGSNFHEACMNTWIKQKGRDATCPFCRTPWPSVQSGNSGEAFENEGYVNLGALQGQSQRRDTSTYYSSSYYYNYSGGRRKKRRSRGYKPEYW